MNFEHDINDAFLRLGFFPRPGQVEAVDKILTMIVIDGKNNVVLNAPTGAGKSLIGAAVAETLSALLGKRNHDINSSISLTATNVLASQYETTFAKLAEQKYDDNGDDEDKKTFMFTVYKGANNYVCSAFSAPERQVRADLCSYSSIVKKEEFEDIVENHCEICEYRIQKNKRKATRHLATNYSYYFLDRLYIPKYVNLAQRDIVIWDEAHLVNDIFSNHYAIVFSEKSIVRLMKDLSEELKVTDAAMMKLLKKMKEKIAADKLNESNIVDALNELKTVYENAKKSAERLAANSLSSRRINDYQKFKSLADKYSGLYCRVDDYFKVESTWIFETAEKQISLKPVFIDKNIKRLFCGNFNLFMSATISPEVIEQTMDFPPGSVGFIKLNSQFPKENKKVVFFDTQPLSYKTLQDKNVIKKLKENTLKIVKHHIRKGERGVILSPSFKLQEEILSELKKDPSFSDYTLFEQKQGEKLEPILKAFKAHKGVAVLASPGMFEGVDLPGDLSRFQILVKAPFPSLADKRVKYILDNHQKLYNILTVMKMVQGFGRSVRSPEDYAISYCLDANAERLFCGPANIWKDEFQISHSKFLID